MAGEEGILRARSDTEVIPPPPEVAGHAGVVREPRRIGPYRIVRVIGRGGMGTVFRGEVVESCSVPMGREVAIKILRKVDDDERLRFRREVGYLQALRHPGIVRVLDHGEHDGRPYLVMPLLEGQLLDALVANAVRQGRPGLAPTQAAEILVQALEALHVAHLAGILHRDLKPGNLMLTQDGTVKLLDFGLAMRLDRESGMTQTGAVVGTPAYMSPEQAAGERGDLSRRSDLYAMGACLYELLTGQQPFTADNAVALLRRVIEAPLIPPRQYVPDLPRDLEAIVLVAMARDPRDRYASAEAMAGDLRRFLRGERVRAHPPGWLRRSARATWRHRRAFATLALVICLCVGLLAATLRKLLIERAVQRQMHAVAAWEEVYRLPGALAVRAAGGASVPALVPFPSFGADVHLAQLPTVFGAVRLAATITPQNEQTVIDLTICDRDIGRGYRLRLQCRASAAGGDRLVLQRDGLTVTSAGLGRLERGRPLRLWFSREEDVIAVAVEVSELAQQVAGSGPDDPLARDADGRFPLLRFRDLTPIEGDESAGVTLALIPGEADVGDLVLERRRLGLTISALAPADVLRQDGKHARALALYEQFLRDQPGSPLARDAVLRSALCLESMGDHLHALERFRALATSERSDERYALTALFHAWSCALRLSDYALSESLFTQVRRDYDAQALAAQVPQALLSGLVRDYLDRGQRALASDLDRAMRLFISASDIAEHLGLTEELARARMSAGEALIALQRLDDAAQRFDAAARDLRQSVATRLRALTALAGTERLREHRIDAALAYRAVMSDPSIDEAEAQWARLWLGDLTLGETPHPDDPARSEALAIWRNSPESASLPGRLMKWLCAPDGEELTGATPSERLELNDAEYFAARQHQLHGRLVAARERLIHVTRLGPAQDWPVPLAERLIERLRPLLPPE